MPNDPNNPALGRPIEDLDVSNYVLNRLYELGDYHRTLGAVCRFSEQDLLRIPGFGDDCLEKTVAALAKWGLELAKQDFSRRR